MTPEEFTQLEQVCSLLFEDARERLVTLVRLPARQTHEKVKGYLESAVSAVPGPETLKIVNALQQQGKTVAAQFDATVVSLAELLKKSIQSGDPAKELKRALDAGASGRPQPRSLHRDEGEAIAKAIAGERINRCFNKFFVATAILSFQPLAETLVESELAFVGEESDLALKAVAASETLLEKAAGIFAGLAFGPVAEIVQLFRELQKALRKSKRREFVASIKAASGTERMLALTGAYDGIAEQARFTGELTRKGIEAIDGFTATLEQEVIAAKAALRHA